MDYFRAAAEQRGLPAEQIEKLLAPCFVAGPPTNVQFTVKDSKKYAATEGWGFARFTNGKPSGEAVHKTCLAATRPLKSTTSFHSLRTLGVRMPAQSTRR